MSRPLQRTYSFDNNNNEVSLSSIGQDRYNQFPQGYHDGPLHDDQAAPPPTYAAYVPPVQNHDLPSPLSHQTQSNAWTDSHQTNYPEPYSRHTPYQEQGNPFVEARHDSYDPHDLGYSTSMRTAASTVTAGMDNFGATAAGGGIEGIALGIANTYHRDSGMQAVNPLRDYSPSRDSDSFERGHNTIGTDTPYIPEPPYGTRTFHHNDSYSSTAPLGNAAASAGDVTPRPYVPGGSMQMTDYPPPDAFQGPLNSFADNPYKRYSSAWDPRVGQAEIYPDEIEDDGEDGIGGPLSPHRRSMLGFGSQSSHSLPKTATLPGAAAGGVLGNLGSKVSRKPVVGALTPSGNYKPIIGPGYDDLVPEKSEWLESQTSGRRRLRWIVGSIIALLIIAGIVGGVIGGIKASQNKSTSSGTGGTADGGSGDLDSNSPEIKALLGNPNLHRVFPGIDYTPMNCQYPACLTDPPSQNSVTLDMAVLSQLTNVVRLYGTDCNQTEMVLHAINKLGLTDMKVWLAVWLDNNATTNARGMAAMYDLISTNGADPFAGVIIGNEVLFRKDMTIEQLGDITAGVKSNLTAKNINLPIAIADLGTVWTTALVDVVDIVMSNIHPFFAGVPAAEAAGWTWDFWQQYDVVLTTGMSDKKNIISETGWPSAGGNDCGGSGGLNGVNGTGCTSTTDGSVAGIDEMNTFMDTFVCQSLANGTNYFWFEAFDEPWKIVYDEPGQDWEDKWGLMDVNRNLKPGLQIPDCGGKTV